MDVRCAVIHDRFAIVLFRYDVGAVIWIGPYIGLIDLVSAFVFTSIVSIVLVIETEENDRIREERTFA